MSEETENTGEQSRPDDAGPAASTKGCPVVGIGASAGGVDALRRLLPQLEPECGMAFVVVQHLDPDHASWLSEVLARSSSLPVSLIENDTAVQPDRVYVIPPNASLTIHNGRLRLVRPIGSRAHRNTIDEFLTSLARDRGENAACVILSGTGSDGTLGLRAIRENGGLTLAQSDAEYDGMMRSAMSTGLVDFTLPLEEIPAKLADFFDHLSRIEHQAEQPGSEAATHLNQIITLLRHQTSHDFSNYKDRTIIRRIQRRMNVLQIDTVPGFIDRLRRDSHEVTLLFHDLLIGVTNFFRDPEAFAVLEREVVPELFKGKGADDTIRVWVPGCATGEEAYSIAMLLRDQAPKSQNSPRLQIFASDIDGHALETARIGRYPAAISKDVPSQRLERYFVREDGTLRIASDIREICLFSQHNLLRDAPLSRLDLISCRNLLIYLGSELQERVISLFHYAVSPDKYLFLGPSENVTRNPNLFVAVDRENRIFRRRSISQRRIPEFPLITPEVSQRPAPARRSAIVEPSLRAAAERRMLERFAPAFVVTSADGEVLHLSGRTGKYLELPAGPLDTNLFNLARSGLRLEFRAAMHKAVSTGELVTRNKLVFGTNGGNQQIDLHIQPLRFGPSSEVLYIVVFQDIGDVKPAVEAEVPSTSDAEDTNMRELEAELRASRERLQATAEELESSNEELKSSNEELQSTNEELQSTNEELETSKEELQSINEELQTVNSELNARVDELSRANNDMANLLDSTQIATVFLDRTLAVKGFTPAAKDVFRLVEGDAGRPIMHVRARFHSEGLQEDAERVLRTLTTIERPIRVDENQTRYIMRALPYRTTDNVIDGIVLTFTDVTRITAAEARIEELTNNLRARVDDLETILDLVPSGVMIVERDRTAGVLINSYGARLLGVAEDHKGLRPASVPFRFVEDGNGNGAPSERQPLEQAARGESVSNWQGLLENHRGMRIPVMVSATPLFSEGDETRGAVAAIVDVTEHKRAEEQQQFWFNELQHRVKNILTTVSALATRMLREDASLTEFRDTFLGRLNAMARMHNLLAREPWSGVSVRALVELGLEPYVAGDKQNITLEGEEVILLPKAATTLGMVLYELETNAAKYGALSRAGGRVEVAWRVLDAEPTADRRVRLSWTERDGPPIDRSSAPGFGTEFITRSIQYELGGTVLWERKTEALHCVIEFPVAGNVDTNSRGDVS